MCLPSKLGKQLITPAQTALEPPREGRAAGPDARAGPVRVPRVAEQVHVRPVRQEEEQGVRQQVRNNGASLGLTSFFCFQLVPTFVPLPVLPVWLR